MHDRFVPEATEEAFRALAASRAIDWLARHVNESLRIDNEAAHWK